MHLPSSPPLSSLFFAGFLAAVGWLLFSEPVGPYGGRITFWEEMVAHRTLTAKPQSCSPIKQPKAVATGGFYPTVSCLRYHASTGETTVSLERFAFRAASAPVVGAGEPRADSPAPRHPKAGVHTH